MRNLCRLRRIHQRRRVEETILGASLLIDAHHDANYARLASATQGLVVRRRKYYFMDKLIVLMTGDRHTLGFINNELRPIANLGKTPSPTKTEIYRRLPKTTLLCVATCRCKRRAYVRVNTAVFLLGNIVALQRMTPRRSERQRSRTPAKRMRRSVASRWGGVRTSTRASSLRVRSCA